MSTRKATVEGLIDQLPGVTARPMFGEYALYLRGQVVALVCDDRLFIKPRPEVEALLPDAPRALPHGGTTLEWIIADQAMDESETVLAVLSAVAAAREAAPPKRARKRPPIG